MTGQAEVEVCKKEIEKGKKSSWETENYTAVGNGPFKFFFFFLCMLFSNGNGSFAGGRVMLKEIESVLQGLNEENELGLVAKEMVQKSEAA